MTGLEFHHVGYACENFETQLRHFLALGYKPEGDSFEDSTQKVRGCFLSLGANRIELLEPTREDSPIWPYLRKNIHMYHLAYMCESFLAKIEELKSAGAVLVAKPQPSVAFKGRQICFLMLRNQLLVELIEAESRR